MEALCCWEEEDSQHTRDLIYDLVLLGGTATDNCYESIRKRNWRRADKPLEHYCALLQSGYYPTKGNYLDYPMSYYFLDDLAKAIERYRGEPTPDFLSMLYKTVKLGDSLGINGPIQSQLIIDNINSLPSLETGVTHSKDGPMEKLLNRFPIDKVRDLKLDPQKQQQLAQEEEKEKIQEERMEKEELKRKGEKNVRRRSKRLSLCVLYANYQRIAIMTSSKSNDQKVPMQSVRSAWKNVRRGQQESVYVLRATCQRVYQNITLSLNWGKVTRQGVRIV